MRVICLWWKPSFELGTLTNSWYISIRYENTQKLLHLSDIIKCDGISVDDGFLGNAIGVSRKHNIFPLEKPTRTNFAPWGEAVRNTSLPSLIFPLRLDKYLREGHLYPHWFFIRGQNTALLPRLKQWGQRKVWSAWEGRIRLSVSDSQWARISVMSYGRRRASKSSCKHSLIAGVGWSQSTFMCGCAVQRCITNKSLRSSAFFWGSIAMEIFLLQRGQGVDIWGD